jgi:hypothetical protein
MHITGAIGFVSAGQINAKKFDPQITQIKKLF